MNPESSHPYMIDATPRPEARERKEYALDERWYERFRALYTALNFSPDPVELRAEKDAFFKNPTSNPHFTWRIDVEVLRERERMLRQLQHEILREEHNDSVRILYDSAIEEQVEIIKTLCSSAVKDMESFRGCIEHLFGNPDPEEFFYILDRIRHELEPHLRDATPLSFAARQLEAVLPPHARRSFTKVGGRRMPDARIMERSVAQFGSYIDQLTHERHYRTTASSNEQITRDTPDYQAEDLKRYISNLFNHYRLTGWSVEIRQGQTVMAVDHEKKCVYIPHGRTYDKDRMCKLALHEFTHILIREYGESSKIRLLGLGLENYRTSEEGVTTMLEQVYDYKTNGVMMNDFFGADRYFAVGLATGMGGDENQALTPRDFKDLFTILQPYYLFKKFQDLYRHDPKKVPEYFEGTADLNAQSLLQSSRQDAWVMCLRVFNGTQCDTFARNTSMHIYRTGNRAIWDIFKKMNITLPWILLGKKNLMDPAQWLLLLKSEISGIGAQSGSVTGGYIEEELPDTPLLRIDHMDDLSISDIPAPDSWAPFIKQHGLGMIEE